MKNYEAYRPEQLAAKRILVTGGTSGIGRATALMLASFGARVFVFGLDRQELEDTLTPARAHGLQIDGITADVTHPEDVRRVFQRIDEHWGKLDVLINCAAIGGWDIATTPYEQWQRMVQINLSGYLHTTQEALTRMEDGAHIVMIASMSAEVREKGSSVYVATKAGVEGFGGALRKEVSSRGIRVTVIEPGATATPMQTDDIDVLEAERNAMQMLDPDDVAASIVYALAQPKRSHVMLVQVKPLAQEI